MREMRDAEKEHIEVYTHRDENEQNKATKRLSAPRVSAKVRNGAYVQSSVTMAVTILATATARPPPAPATISIFLKLQQQRGILGLDEVVELKQLGLRHRQLLLYRVVPK